MKLTIEIEDDSFSALFTRAATEGSLDRVTKTVEEVLSLGGVAKIMQKGTVLQVFRSSGEFVDHVNSLLSRTVKCPNCQYEFKCGPELVDAENRVECVKCGGVIQLN